MARLGRSLTCAVLLLALAIPARGQVLCRIEADDIAALRTFDKSVSGYADLHRRLAAGVTCSLSSDHEVVAAAGRRLADAIRFERRGAAEGDVFTPEVADLIRVRLEALHPAALAAERYQLPAFGEEGLLALPMPAVNSQLMTGTTLLVGESIARVLPPLPPELEYRMTPRSLILADVGTGLVVDLMDWP